MSGLRSRLGDSVTVGTFLKLPIVESVELMALAKLDLVVVDLEHSPMSMESAARLLAMAKALGLGTLVRIPAHGYEWVQRSLDAGAGGVLVPHVDTREQAERAVDAARFPPLGSRGFGPTTRAGDWALESTGTYVRNSEEAAVVVQIESSAGVENVREIIDAGVDSVFVGPADLSVAMGVRGDSTELAHARDAVLTAAKDRGISCGIASGDGSSAKRLISSGFSYAVVGNDATMLGQSAQRMMADFLS